MRGMNQTKAYLTVIDTPLPLNMGSVKKTKQKKIKQKKTSERNAITTVYEDAEFIENGSDSGTFIHNGKECKYRVEDGKIKCYIYTDTGDVEVKSINLKQILLKLVLPFGGQHQLFHFIF